MSEHTVEGALIPEPTNNEAALLAVYRQNAELTELINILQGQVRDAAAEVAEAQKEAGRKLDRATVRSQIISLASELTGESDDDFNSDALASINETLETLGLDTIVKKFTMSVRVRASQVVEIEVEAESLEAATDAIEGGEYESELLGELDAGSFEVEDYLDVEEA